MSVNLATQMRDYAREVDAIQEPVTIDELMVVRVGHGPVRPVAPRTRSVTSSHRRRNLLVAASFAIFLVLLVGGVAWFARSGQDSEVVDLPTPTETTGGPTTTVPPERESAFEEEEVIADTTPLGVVLRTTTPSSLGDIAWTVLEGGPAFVPSRIVETDSGYATTTEGGGLLVSSDGASWTEVSVPEAGELRSLDWRDGRYVLEVVGEDGISRFWETNDLLTWQPTQGAPSELSDATSGLGVTTRIFPGARGESRGATLTFWNVFARIDWRSIALLVVGEDQRDSVQELFITAEIDAVKGEIELVGYVDERDAFDGRDPDESLGLLGMAVAESGDRWIVDLSVAATGEQLGSIEGSLEGGSFEDTFDRLRFGLSEGFLTLETATGLEFVDVPWDDPDNRPELVGNDDGFVVVRRIGDYESPFRMEVWASQDGREWRNLTVATSEEMGDINSFSEHDGVMIVTFGHTDDVSRYVIWRSDDGITWAPPSVPPVPTWDDFDDGFGNVLYNATGDAYGLPAGWVWLSGNETDFALWTSSDGDVWEQVDVTGVPVPFWAQFEAPDGVGGGGGGSQWISGSSVFIRSDQERGNRQQPSKVWIISFPA